VHFISHLKNHAWNGRDTYFFTLSREYENNVKLKVPIDNDWVTLM